MINVIYTYQIISLLILDCFKKDFALRILWIKYIFLTSLQKTRKIYCQILQSKCTTVTRLC